MRSAPGGGGAVFPPREAWALIPYMGSRAGLAEGSLGIGESLGQVEMLLGPSSRLWGRPVTGRRGLFGKEAEVWTMIGINAL